MASTRIGSAWADQSITPLLPHSRFRDVRGRTGKCPTPCTDLAEIGQDVAQDVVGGEGRMAEKIKCSACPSLNDSSIWAIVLLFPVITVEDPHHVGREADAFDAILATVVQAVEL